MGFIGFGAIAQRVAKYLGGFDCSLIAYDPNINREAAKNLGVKEASIDELLPKADIVSLHLPAMPETIGMVNRDFFSKMKKDAVIVNTSRGPIINEQDLCDALRSGTIAGAALDVMAVEPPGKDNPLYAFENVVLTPHCAWNTLEGSWRVAKEAAERVCELRDGREIKKLVNANFLNNRES